MTLFKISAESEVDVVSVNEPLNDATDKDMNEFVSIQSANNITCLLFFHYNVTTIHRHLGWVDHMLLDLLNH